MGQTPAGPGIPADLILRGGSVITMDGRNSEAEAIAVSANEIVFVGSSQDAMRFAGNNTQVIELNGRAVIPGINDSHLHGAWLGALWPDTIIGGAGFQSPAARLETGEDRRNAILRTGRLLASLGITSYTEPGLGPGEDNGPTGCFGSGVLDAYRELADAGDLTARVTVLNLFGELDGASDIESFERGLRGFRPYEGDQKWLHLAGVKIFADGIPPMHNAWTHHCYPDGSSGDLLVDGTDTAAREGNLRRMILSAHAAGHQIGVHATGDRSIETFLEAVESAGLESARAARHYVIHGDLISGAALARLGSLGMGINIQPGIAVATAPMLAGVLSDQIAASAWPILSAMGGPAKLCLSSDAPVLSPDWRQGIAAAGEWVGTGHGMGNRELMTGLLRSYTSHAAWQDKAEAWKGTLEPGKAADLCVLEHNPLEVSPGDLPGVRVDLTVVDGRIVYDRESAAGEPDQTVAHF
ncbi:amidohydrolase family protein [Arthrobacter sp. Helios]|uniref:amidohydrolase n=1 Tax=Arthrobacter sp. Helios TaxID=2828862 RepID=UPI00206CAA77|nr:amidohydrolase family protein [Arthrobacter sp. Helios]UPO77192.1 amidohydrolase family protein [Arthrobacter sp. Helios]